MMPIIRKLLPLSDCLPLFPDLAQQLPGINQALRNINFGKMDYLPYEEAVSGYELAMRSDISPGGPGKPPSMGHWQLEVSRTDATYQLRLQGKTQKGEEMAELLFPCGESSESQLLSNLP